jgi:hypothetical protein
MQAPWLLLTAVALRHAAVGAIATRLRARADEWSEFPGHKAPDAKRVRDPPAAFPASSSQLPASASSQHLLSDASSSPRHWIWSASPAERASSQGDPSPKQPPDALWRGRELDFFEDGRGASAEARPAPAPVELHDPTRASRRSLPDDVPAVPGTKWASSHSADAVTRPATLSQVKRDFWANHRVTTFDETAQRGALEAEAPPPLNGSDDDADLLDRCEYLTSSSCDCKCQKALRAPPPPDGVGPDGSGPPTEAELRARGVLGPPGDGLADMTPLPNPFGEGKRGPSVDPGMVGHITDEVKSIAKATPKAAGALAQKAFGEMMGAVEDTMNGAVADMANEGIGGSFDDPIPKQLAPVAVPADEIAIGVVNAMVPSGGGGVPDMPSLNAPADALLTDNATFRGSR